MRDRQADDVNDGPVQFAKRELRREFSTPRVWAALVAAGLVLGLVGPFGTYDGVPLVPRLGYWLAVALVTYAAGVSTVYLLVGAFRYYRGMPGLGVYALAGAAGGLPVAAIVIAFNAALFGNAGPAGSALLLVAYCMVIAAAVSVLIAMFSMPSVNEPAVAVQPVAERPRPALLDRLPLDRRGRLSHLTMQDHYVEVFTEKGSTLVLMRLADAIAETTGVEGVQIHRSHWVAKAAVASTARRDGRLFLKLVGGAELPVSRGYMSAVREAGLSR